MTLCIILCPSLYTKYIQVIGVLLLKLCYSKSCSFHDLRHFVKTYNYKSQCWLCHYLERQYLHMSTHFSLTSCANDVILFWSSSGCPTGHWGSIWWLYHHHNVWTHGAVLYIIYTFPVFSWRKKQTSLHGNIRVLLVVNTSWDNLHLWTITTLNIHKI